MNPRPGLTLLTLCFVSGTLLSGCGPDLPKGSPEERACESFMAIRKKDKLPAGAAEAKKCVSALEGMKTRAGEYAHACALSAVPGEATLSVIAVEERLRVCELQNPPSGTERTPEFERAVLAQWDTGLLGDSPSLTGALDAANAPAAAAKTQLIEGCVTSCTAAHGSEASAAYDECFKTCSTGGG